MLKMFKRSKSSTNPSPDPPTSSPQFHFGVVGIGRMGASIAGMLALRGFQVVMYDRSPFDRQKGMDIMRADLKAHVDSQLIMPEEKEQALKRVKMVETLQELMSCQVVLECIPEDLEAKRSLFRQLEGAAVQVGRTDTIFTSNTINFSIKDISKNTVSPNRIVCGLRFLHPVWWVDDVEISGPWFQPPSSLNPLNGLLQQGGFKPFFQNTSNAAACWRKKLTLEEAETCRRRQQDRAAAHRQEHGFSVGGMVGLGNNAPPQHFVDPRNDTSSGFQGGQLPCTPGRESRGSVSSAGGASPCIICTDFPASTVLAPCGHKVMCAHCAGLVPAGPGPGGGPGGGRESHWQGGNQGGMPGPVWGPGQWRGRIQSCPVCRAQVERVLLADQ